MYANQNKETFIQTLQDAGYDNKTIDMFINSVKNGKTDEGLKLLEQHRRSLLNGIHKKQKQIDCLDYFIYTIQKKPETRGKEK